MAGNGFDRLNAPDPSLLSPCSTRLRLNCARAGADIPFMPDLEWNLRAWDREYDWSRAGDEWSDGVGGAEGQWYWFMYPRIHRYLPARRVLEIAPGFGRWTQFLIEHTPELIGVDLAPKCVDACKKRFAHRTNFSCYVNDGLTLPMIENRSIDFVFSFGSLVHAESDVMESYVREIQRVLSPSGVAFLHHSNAGFRTYDGPAPHNFGASVTAELVADLTQEYNLLPLVQETFSWGTPLDEPISCITIVAQPTSPFVRPFVRFRNELPDAGAAHIEALFKIYR